MNTDNRASLLSLVRPQIDSTLGLVHAAMVKHVSQVAGNSALTPCVLHLHQVYGALRMVRLEGATRYAAELETALRSSMRSAAAEKIEIEAISRAVITLREFISDVAAGGENVPLKLFPAYRDLARVSGNEAATEKDLFFPDTASVTPTHAEPRAITAEVMPALLKELRSRYQRGLLGWLKESAKPDGLTHMRDVLDTLHKISAGLPEPHGLWWASIALIEAVIEALPDVQQSDWIVRVKPVCSRIDFLLRDLVTSAAADPRPVLRDVLYAIAISRATTKRVSEVRACFALDDLLPTALAAGASAAHRLQPVLDHVQARFENIKDTWTEYASGEPRRLQRFREMLAPLTEKARELGNPPLLQLIEAIAAATSHLPDPYPLDGQLMSLEMASALLMAEGIVQHFDDLPADLEQQVAIMRGWLTDATQGKTATTSPPGLRPDIVQKVNDAKLRMATAREILKSLAQVEKAVEAFTRDRSRYATLAPLATTMQQVSGVFQVSNQKRAGRLATVCQRLIERCANPDHKGVDQDVEWVAEGLGSLGFYLEPCQHGKLPADRAVNMFFTRYEMQAGNDAILTMTQSMPAVKSPAAEALSGAAVAEIPVATPTLTTAPAREGIDREMLDVFLEEASEVLAAIDGGVAQLQRRADDHDALLSVRRAFHTLKGSARMVGLQAFGECAWEMEQVMNHWRTQSLAATPELLALVGDARELLSEWAYALQGEADPGIDVSGITNRARELRGESDAVQSPPAAVPASPPAPEDFMTLAVSSEAALLSTAVTPVAPGMLAARDAVEKPPAEDFMTIAMTQRTVESALATTVPAGLMAPPVIDTVQADDTKTARIPTPSPAPSASTACEDALADLGDRLNWLGGLVNEMQTEATTDAQSNTRLQEIAQMMQESMAEAKALHCTLNDHIAALKK